MESAWKNEAHQRFWDTLLNQRVDGIIKDKEYLRSLRNNWEAMTRIHKHLGPTMEARGLDLMSLVMRASVPPSLDHLDEEDEEKMASLSVNPYSPRKKIREDMPVFRFTNAADWCPRDVLEVILSFARLADPSPPPSEPDCNPEYDSQGNYGHFGVEILEPTFSPLV